MEEGLIDYSIITDKDDNIFEGNKISPIIYDYINIALIHLGLRVSLERAGSFPNSFSPT